MVILLEFNLDIKNVQMYIMYYLGLSLLVYALQDDYICSSTKGGFRFAIHNSSLYPFVDNAGFDVHPGYINSFCYNK